MSRNFWQIPLGLKDEFMCDGWFENGPGVEFSVIDQTVYLRAQRARRILARGNALGMGL